MDKKLISLQCALSSFFKGQEKGDFWSLLGGKGSYTDERVLKNVGEATVPRLFHGSNASGSFKSKYLSWVCTPKKHDVLFFSYSGRGAKLCPK